MARFQPTHNMSRTNLYRVWISMRARCNNPNSQEYDRYGGRGITVCDLWQKSFEAFHDWAIENGYAHGLWIERINNDAGYSPDNCKWATRAEQMRNRGNCCMITFNGQTQCVTAWAEEIGVSRDAIFHRLSRGWTLDEALLKHKYERRGK